jgi:hypothetical protein
MVVGAAAASERHHVIPPLAVGVSIMPATAETSQRGELDQLVREALKHQYHAALSLLQQAVQRCPDGEWTRGDPAFWQVAYHTTFYTHLYLQPNEAAFKPWEHGRDEYHFLGTLPEPPHRPPKLGEPYTKAQVLEYLEKCQQMVDSAVDALNLTARDAGFWWYKMSKVEHQIHNIRHIEHHTIYLSARLRAIGGKGVD